MPSVVASRPAPESTRPRRPDTTMRTDIQALRALAVVAVVLFHFWPKRLPGGYIGVDIFFVISGYLITSHLMRELVATGRLRVGPFWAKRAKRLLPASLLVLLTTTIGILVWVPRTLWDQFLSEVLTSTFYVENWRLASDSVDYLASGNDASPVQHFWTLSVEEQFYIALPLILLFSVFVLRRVSLKRAALAVVIVCTAASLVYGVWFTVWSPSASYFSTLTRAWEFGVGALVAYLPAAPRRVRVPLTAAGLAGVGVALLAYSSSTPFPGAGAMLPVLGTAAVIYAGAHTFLAAIGRFRPVAFLGRVSYSTYLIHWPLIVLVPFITGHQLRTLEKVALIVVALVASWLCTSYVEDPVRFSPRLLGMRRPRVVAAWSAAGMAVVAALAGGALIVSSVQAGAAAQQAAALTKDLPPCFGAASLDPKLAPCANPDLDGMIVPAASEARKDEHIREECWSSASSTAFRVCSLGPKTGYSRHILAIGDSHNNALVDTYEKIANMYGWRIDAASHAGCYWTEGKLGLSNEVQTRACEQWRKAASAYVAEAKGLDAILVTKTSRGKDASQSMVDRMADAWKTRPAGTKLIALLDNPRLPDDVAVCVERDESKTGKACGLPRSKAIFDDGQVRAARQVAGTEIIDLTDYYCTKSYCPAVIGGVVVYRDGNHLTSTYAATITPYLAQRLNALVGG